MGRTSDSRQRLMHAAHELIWGYSYGAVTIEAICAHAKVKKGSFYYFFDSKADLAVAAINAWWDERRQLMDHVFHPSVRPLDRIAGYLGHVVQSQLEKFEASGQVLGCPLFTLGSEISTQDERIRTLLHGILGTLARHFEAAIRDAQAAGDVEGSDATLKGRHLWAFYEGTLTQARIDNNPELLRHLCADALALIGARSFLAAA
jgi:TetR/AcrR family transcriptional repressor of nem operon